MSDTRHPVRPFPNSTGQDGLPNIASIPPGVPFLPTLVESLLNGTLFPGLDPLENPLALADVTIWVPTRRAVRSLTSEFTARFPAEVSILPDIRALGEFELGEFDEDELIFKPARAEDAGPPDPVIAPVQRQIILARLIHGWALSLKPEQKALYQGKDIVMPASLTDAIWFAAELGQLMDTVATEESSWSDLNDLVPDDYADWWQLTLEFLKIATVNWPNILQDLGLLDPAIHRVQKLREQALLYREKGASGPVIAAGSTGSIPATAALLESIAALPEGLVVLPGLDRDLDAETWEKVDLPDNEIDDSGTAPGHPQFGLKKLLSHLGSTRAMQEIAYLAGESDRVDGALRLREKLVSEALRPPHATGQWQNLFKLITANQVEQALQGIALVEAVNQREEAIAIAIALRETVENPDHTAALVTPDRNLARRVAAELSRFGISVDDSAGQPLSETDVGTLVRLVNLVACSPPSNLALASLLSHPLAKFGTTAKRARHAARLIELTLLRGGTNPPIPGNFLALVNARKLKIENPEARVHRAIRRLTDEDWQDAIWLAGRLDEIFTTQALQELGEAPIDQRARLTIDLVEACAKDDNGQFGDFYGTSAGRDMTTFLGELLDQGDLMEVPLAQWPDAFDALIASRVTRKVGQEFSRITILGPLEARLQNWDRVVLGGLNEKTWPASTRNDAFLSRPMKSTLGLPPPERRTGLAAHDFQMMMGMKNVVLTRSTKADNAPTVASRWLQRLNIVAGEEPAQTIRTRGQVYLDWARNLDEPAGPANPCSQPKPVPALELRPNALSITDVETWINDPYAIYARRILGLAPLDPLQREVDARERGTLYHDIMEDFVNSDIDPTTPDALDRLLSIASEKFKLCNIPDDIAGLWWPRFVTIAGSFLDWQGQHANKVQSSHVELSGQTKDGLDGFTLRGRADRIDVLKSGQIAIFDYKTGSGPTAKSVVDFKSPQLSLEAAMARRGAFGEEVKHSVALLGYIRLRPTDPLKVDLIGEAVGKTPDAETLADEAWERLGQLIKAYRDVGQEYRSKARQSAARSFADDYDHLARVREWSVAEDGEDES
ncbi:MAG: double-strand break repair protein AddB [Rhizobiaceae bacterium]